MQWAIIDFVAAVGGGAIVGGTAVGGSNSYARGAVALLTLVAVHRVASLLRFHPVLGKLADHRICVLVADGQVRRGPVPDLVPFGEAVRAWFAISLQTFSGPAGQIADAAHAGGGAALDRAAPVPALAELLHAAVRPGGAAVGDLRRLAAQRRARRPGRRRPVRAARGGRSAGAVRTAFSMSPPHDARHSSATSSAPFKGPTPSMPALSRRRTSSVAFPIAPSPDDDRVMPHSSSAPRAHAPRNAPTRSR